MIQNNEKIHSDQTKYRYSIEIAGQITHGDFVGTINIAIDHMVDYLKEQYPDINPNDIYWGSESNLDEDLLGYSRILLFDFILSGRINHDGKAIIYTISKNIELIDEIKYSLGDFQYGSYEFHVSSFPVGTHYFVQNGHWNGIVAQNQNGEKINLIGITPNELHRIAQEKKSITREHVPAVSIGVLTDNDMTNTIQSHPSNIHFYEDLPVIITHD